jgi:ankyrin repeat protein
MNPQKLTAPLYFRIDPSLRLRRAIHANDPLLVSRICKSHPPYLLQNPDFSPLGLSNTSLHLACSLGHLAVVRTLLALGHERDGVSLNEEHQTPLMIASAAGHTEIVHLLCKEFPDNIARRDSRGRDAIMEASRGGHDTCLQILLTFAPGGPAALLNNADIDGNTALHFASSYGHLLVLRTLLAAGADSEKRNAWSWTPVSYSATVQAEVYFKGLVAEVEKRRTMRKEAEIKGTGAGVRLVSGEEA